MTMPAQTKRSLIGKLNKAAGRISSSESDALSGSDSSGARGRQRESSSSAAATPAGKGGGARVDTSSQGMPAAGSVHLDVADSDGTEPYDDQADVSNQVAGIRLKSSGMETQSPRPSTPNKIRKGRSKQGDDR